MNRIEMKSIVEMAYRRYVKMKNDITKGFIKKEHVDLVAKSLFLEDLTNEELNEMWNASYDYFDNLYCIRDTNGEIIGYKDYTSDVSFAKDTQSAWSEVINEEARKRKKENRM